MAGRATVEVDVMPFMSRRGGPNRTADDNTTLGGPFESYYSALQDLGSDFTRFAPWFGYPKTVVAELRRPNCSAGSPVRPRHTRVGLANVAARERHLVSATARERP